MNRKEQSGYIEELTRSIGLHKKNLKKQVQEYAKSTGMSFREALKVAHEEIWLQTDINWLREAQKNLKQQLAEKKVRDTRAKRLKLMRKLKMKIQRA